MSFPKLIRLPWYERELIGAMITGLTSLCAASVTYYKCAGEPIDPWISLSSVVVLTSTSLGLLLAVLRGRQKDKDAASMQTPRDIVGCVYVLRAMICAIRGIPLDRADKTPRITIWRVAPPHEVEQLIKYIGGAGGEPGRKQSCKSGIVGKAVTCKEPVFAKRVNDDYEKFVYEMINEWNFDEHDARQLSPSRFAWAAIPLAGKNGQVEAVVFIDSEDRNFFSGTSFKTQVVQACTGISEYVRLRY